VCTPSFYLEHVLEKQFRKTQNKHSCCKHWSL